MKNILSIPSLVLISFTIRMLITGADIGDALVIIGFSGLYAYYLFLESKKDVPVNKDILDRIVATEEQLQVVKSKTDSIMISTTLRR